MTKKRGHVKVDEPKTKDDKVGNPNNPKIVKCTVHLVFVKMTVHFYTFGRFSFYHRVRSKPKDSTSLLKNELSFMDIQFD